MIVPTYIVYGFDSTGARYIVDETLSAAEARDLRDVRAASGFESVVFGPYGELTDEALDRLARRDESLH